MNILSFDVGIVNLAYCIMEYSTHKILKWEVINLENTTDHNKLYINLINNLDSRPHLINGIHTVLIEKQPSFNPKMRIIAGCLQTYFFIIGIIDSNDKISLIKFYSPKHKLKCYTSNEVIQVSGSNKYTQTKKLGVIICKKKIEEYSEPQEILSFFNDSKKKDDLSDCYLQALTYILMAKKLIDIKSTPKIQVVESTPKITKKQVKEYIMSIIQNNKVSVTELNNHYLIKEYSARILKEELNNTNLRVLFKELSILKYLNNII